MIRNLFLGVALTALAAGAYGVDPPAKAPAPAKAAATHEGFERMKKLEGTWMEADKEGKPTDKVVSVIKVTAAGSAVHETSFPGTPMEMVSVYHLDKGELVMTHYCALGNQPRMKADPKSAKNTIHFAFDGGSNFDPAKDMHMHEATITFVDDNHFELAGVAWVGGKPAEDHCGTMKLVRKK